MSEEKLIVTLRAERGGKYEETGQCISSHSRSIVFLPREVEPDQVVRVELHTVKDEDGENKLDKRGSVMYWAKFAPAELAKKHKRAIAKEAEELRECTALPKEQGEAVLRAQYGDLPPGWIGFGWYYFEESSAVYGTKFSPAGLTLLEQFPETAETGSTELLAWLLGGLKPSSGDYYRRREAGEDLEWNDAPQISESDIAELRDRLDAGDLVLSERLV